MISVLSFFTKDLTRVVFVGLVVLLSLSTFWQSQRVTALEIKVRDVGIQLANSHTDRAKDRVAYNEERARLAVELAAVSERLRAKEQELATRFQEQQREHLKEIQAQKRIADAHRADRDRLRDEVKRYAAHSAAVGSFGAATSDSLAACLDRAETLGELLVAGVSVQEELAREAETVADSYRRLRRSADAAVEVTRLP